MNDNIIDTTAVDHASSWYIRTYRATDNLVPASPPNNLKTQLRPFEAVWDDDCTDDYPTHDTMPIDFDALGIGEYYEQESIEGVDRTKLGGWPSCVQSEPWWDYSPEGKEFEYVMQIAEEPKAHWHLGGGFGYIARSKANPNRWAIDIQFY